MYAPGLHGNSEVKRLLATQEERAAKHRRLSILRVGLLPPRLVRGCRSTRDHSQTCNPYSNAIQSHQKLVRGA
jgi:hypothetical protein